MNAEDLNEFSILKNRVAMLVADIRAEGEKGVPNLVTLVGLMRRLTTLTEDLERLRSNLDK